MEAEAWKRLRAVIDKSILNELENIDGISNVEVTGGQMKAVEIILDDEAVEAYHITPSKIRSLIGQNSRRKTFVGHAYEKDKHYFVNLESDYNETRDLENIVVNPDGPVLMKDVATVVFGLKEQTSVSRVNGKDAVTIQLVRDANVNLIELSHVTRKVIDRLNRKLNYQDIEIVIQYDAAEDMERNVNLIMELALIGGLLAVLILWFFMRKPAVGSDCPAVDSGVDLNFPELLLCIRYNAQQSHPCGYGTRNWDAPG